MQEWELDKNIWSNNGWKIIKCDEKRLLTDPRSSVYLKQDKYKENHT